MTSQSEIEKVIDGFNPTELLKAQTKSWEALFKIQSVITPGITEVEGVKLIVDELKKLGSVRSWHHPIFRIGKNTIHPYHQPASATQKLSTDDHYFIDIGPTWMGDDGIEYEGDVGKTFASTLHSPHQECIKTGEHLFKKTCDYWRNSDANGEEIYQWLENEANKLGYRLVKDTDGHRIGEFPHKRIYKGGLPSAQFHPSSGLWILEVHIAPLHQNFAAFFEDILR